METDDPIKVLYLDMGNGKEESKVFDEEGLSSVVASSPDEGLEILEEDEFDCVISTFDDSVSKTEFIKEVHEKHPNLPFIVVSENGVKLPGELPKETTVAHYRRASEVTGLADKVKRVVERRNVEMSALEALEDLDKESELKLKERAMDEAPVGITISDPDLPDNPLIYINKKFEEVSGYSREEVMGLNCRFLQGEGTDPETVAEIREKIEAEEPFSVDILNYTKDGEEFWNELNIAPVRNDEGEITNYVGYQKDISERKRLEKEIREEREKLRHVLERVKGLSIDINDVLLESFTQDEIEERVCETVVDYEPYTYASIGEFKLVTEKILPKYATGEKPEFNVGIDVEEGLNPIADAARSKTVQTVQVLDGGEVFGEGEWRSFGLEKGYKSMVAVPIAYKDVLYGVLTIYASEENIFNDREVMILEVIGRNMGHAINALESKQALIGDALVEIKLETTNKDFPFVRLSGEADCVIEQESSTVQKDGTLQVFFSVTDSDPEEILDIVKEFEEFEGTELVFESDDEFLFKTTVVKPVATRQFADVGVSIKSQKSERGEGEIVMEMPQSADVRSSVEAIQRNYPGTELSGYRELDSGVRTKTELKKTLEDELTERQLLALQTAYLSGFFDWPREVSGDDIAESMDISRPTFHEHLRAAERKIFEMLFKE